MIYSAALPAAAGGVGVGGLADPLAAPGSSELSSSSSSLAAALFAASDAHPSAREAATSSRLRGLSLSSGSSEVAAAVRERAPVAPSAAAAAATSASASAAAAASASAAPRIFVGKLPREATEQDVREHFSRFGFVLDVYLPRDRGDRGGSQRLRHGAEERGAAAAAAEGQHRGFGFVTFETRSALRRVVAGGPHVIRGALLAIDSAVPRAAGSGPVGGGGGAPRSEGGSSGGGGENGEGGDGGDGCASSWSGGAPAAVAAGPLSPASSSAPGASSSGCLEDESDRPARGHASRGVAASYRPY